MTDVEVRLLGPVEVVGPAGQAPLLGARQRAIVALLALHPGVVIARPRLVDALWGPESPRTAVKTVNSHIARVRQALDRCGLPNAVITHEHGYALAVPADAVDSWRFEEQLRKGRDLAASGDLDGAAVSLRAGLDLWRGEPAEGLELVGWGNAEFARLREVRVDALGDLCDLELRRGQPGRAADELERLLVSRPTNERLVGLLMLARYRAGSPTAALDAYQRLRTALADELGVDPSPALQELYTAILRQDKTLDQPASVSTVDDLMVRPAQLPAAVGHFTGRGHELAVLDTLLEKSEAGLALVSGAAGMGKTALAVQWAHRVRDRFPDGQLFLDLRGHDREAALAPSAVLAHLLRGLGVAADRLPADLADRVSLYRSLLHDQRVLIVLDNAGDVEDVLPVVPAGTTSVLVVTSRTRLAALASHHAVTAVPLDVLRVGEAVALLRRTLPDRVAAEPVAARRLAELCDRMPLALRLAAARLAARPHQRIGDLVEELSADDPLGALTLIGDSRSVRAVFASAYRGVSSDAARLFRRLSLPVSATVSLHLAAAVAGADPAGVRPVLDELAAAHLLTEVGRDRYRYHDLVQRFARECTPAEDAEAVAAAVIDWYVAVAGAANRLIDPGRDRVVVDSPTHLPFADDHRAALAFLDEERDNLGPVVRYALAHHRPTAAWQLTYLLTGFYDSRGHWSDRVAMCHTGLAAAQVEGDPATEGLMRSALGVACIMTRQFDEALVHLDHALDLARRGGDRRGEGHAGNNIAVALCSLRRFDEAVLVYLQAMAVHTANGHAVGKAVTLINMSEAYLEMGEAARVADHLTEAMRLSVDLGNQRLEAAVHNGFGLARLALGAYPEAQDHLQRALTLRTQSGDHRYAAHSWNDLGLAQLRGGDPEGAAASFRQAIALGREVVDRHVTAIAYHRLGLAQAAVGDTASARRALTLALRLRRQVPDPFEEAHVHRGLGDLESEPDAAKRHWDVAIDLYRKANARAEADALALRSGSAPLE